MRPTRNRPILPQALRPLNAWLNENMTPAVKIIIVINVLVTVFLTFFYAASPSKTEALLNILAEDPNLAVKRGFVWQFLTYMFVHLEAMHLVFNMLTLYFFGRSLENRWGTREFWRFYLLVGVGAGLLHAVIVLATGIESHQEFFQGRIVDVPASMIGASGAIFGVMLAFAAYYPEQIVLLWFFAPVKIKYLMPILAAFELLSTASGSGSGISHLTHLTGLLVAYLLLARRHRQWDIRRWQWSRR